MNYIKLRETVAQYKAGKIELPILYHLCKYFGMKGHVANHFVTKLAMLKAGI